MIHVHMLDGTIDVYEGRLCNLDAISTVYVIEEANKDIYITKSQVVKIVEFPND